MNKLSSIKFKGEEGAKSLYFTSDTHFFHKNVIKYCDRRGDKNPFDRFESAQEMNEHMVEVWNKKVPKDAVVFHLGDFSVGCKDKKALSELIHSLNGRIYLAKGNHESDVTKNPHIASLFEDIRDRYEIYVDDDEISYGKQHIVMYVRIQKVLKCRVTRIKKETSTLIMCVYVEQRVSSDSTKLNDTSGMILKNIHQTNNEYTRKDRKHNRYNIYVQEIS